MDLPEAERVTGGMVNFILKKADDKKKEQEQKGEEEFQIAKLRIINEEQTKIKAEFARKTKMEQTKVAIKRSMAINKSRLKKIKARQAVINQVGELVKDKLVKTLQANAEHHKEFCRKLIVQGLLMLLEDEVTIRCREIDLAMVESCLAAAQDEYASVIHDQAGGTRKAVSLTVEKSRFLPGPSDGSGAPSCMGGVVLICQQGTITVDNTLDIRLNLVLEQDKPRIRALLFPSIGR